MDGRRRAWVELGFGAMGGHGGKDAEGQGRSDTRVLVTLGVGRPHINSPSGLDRCYFSNAFAYSLLYCFFYRRQSYMRAGRGVSVLHNTRFPAPVGAIENIEQVTLEVRY